MGRPSGRRSWNTDDELKYLQNLGKNVNSLTVKTDRAVLLRKYEAVSENRVWPRMVDSGQVKEYLVKELNAHI